MKRLRKKRIESFENELWELLDKKTPDLESVSPQQMASIGILFLAWTRGEDVLGINLLPSKLKSQGEPR